MIDDACRLGLCNFYDSGAGVFGLIAGVVIGAVMILLIQRFSRGRK